MNRRNLFAFALFSAALGTVVLPNATSAQAKNEPLKIGMVKAFFSDLPKELVSIVTDPFPLLMKQTTGFDGTLSTDEDAFATAAKLDAGKLDFGVFHGHEFAWLQKKYPKLTPLVIVANKEHDVRAYVIVKKDSKVQNIAGLRGKSIDYPIPTKEHARVFVARQTGDNAQSDPKAFFSKIERSDSYFDAMKDLCAGKVDAVLLDSITVAFYKEIKGPVFEKNLRVLQQSDEFPPAVLAYKQGALAKDTIDQFRNGLTQAHKNAVGADLMKLWSIDRFDLPPANYADALARSLKEYPSPEPVKVGLR